MKKTFTFILVACFALTQKSKSQVLLNELYTDPGAGKHEFFELYNASVSATPVSLNNFTLVTFFDISGQKGFYVMDLPNISVGAKGYFVGSSALPFNYQGTTGSTASDFSWNNPSLSLMGGYVRKWVLGNVNPLDGNANYDLAILPLNFNDFFFRRTGTGTSYTVFLYNNGVLVNTFLGGTGGQAVILTDIVNMPNLNVDMSGASPDYVINFSGYGSLPVENCNQDAGSDNGFIRQYDGACGAWLKSSSSVMHTPKATNGTLSSGTSNTIAVAAAIWRGPESLGSTVVHDIVGAPATAFPLEMQIYVDNGSVAGVLDATDTYVTSKTETVISQGPFYTQFFPYDANILIVVKTNVGCLDKIQFVFNHIVLAVNNLSFTGHRKDDQVKLNWTVEKNETKSRFEIERSIDNGEFQNTGIVFSTEKNGTENYSYTETADIKSKIQYRLKIFDQQNGITYSKTLAFREEKTGQNNQLTFLGNPVTQTLSFSYQAASSQTARIKIYDMTGQLQMNQQVNSKEGINLFSFSMSSAFKPGMYILEVTAGTERLTGKFVKQ